MAYLILYGVPVSAVLAGIVAAIVGGPRWCPFAALLATAAIAVMVGTSVWYDRGCVEAGACARWVGMSLWGAWIFVAVSLLALAGIVAFRRLTR